MKYSNIRFIFIWISLCQYVQLNAYTTIHDYWMDDYLNGPPLGWSWSKQTDYAKSRVINDTITKDVTHNISYHGPYRGAYVYWLYRQFNCLNYSHLNISYSIISNQDTNYVKFYVNNELFANNYINTCTLNY